MSRKRGLLLVTISAIFWGVSGTAAQRLFGQFYIEVNWLVTTRLLIAGVLLLSVQLFRKERSQVFHIWKNGESAIQLIIFALFGILGAQYTYMASIHHGNAAVATLLQYLAPFLIILYLILRKQAKPTGQDFLMVILALAGCFFLLTNGSLTQLSVSMPAIVWGLLSAVALAFYTVYAVPLLKRYDSLVIMGWAMVVGGIAMSFIHPIWQMDFNRLTPEAYLYLVFVVIFGTMLAFLFYIASLHSLSPKETSLLGSMEPLASVLTMVFWLREPFGFFQWVGSVCIIGMLLLLALNKKDEPISN